MGGGDAEQDADLLSRDGHRGLKSAAVPLVSGGQQNVPHERVRPMRRMTTPLFVSRLLVHRQAPYARFDGIPARPPLAGTGC